MYEEKTFDLAQRLKVKYSMEETYESYKLNTNSSIDDNSIINFVNSANRQRTRQKRTICCVGMCVLDIIHVCSNYPIEDTDKRCLNGYMQRGGNASNNCTVLRELGYEDVEFLGMMSTAKGFEYLFNDCQQRNIINKNCPTVEQSPPFSSVILVENTDSRTIIHSNSNFPILKYQHFIRLRDDLEQYRWIHFEARNPKETLLMQQEINEYNHRYHNEIERQITISVEFEKIFEENLILAHIADYIFLGKDLAMHMGWLDPKAAVYGLRNWLKQNQYSENNRSAIICPWGATGASSLDANDNYSFSTSKPPEKIVDALGAGDTFCAATIYAIAALNMELSAAVDFGSYCAGAKLGIYGYDGIAAKVQNIVTKGTT